MQESSESRVSKEFEESSKHLIIRINQKNPGNLMSTKNLINLKNYKNSKLVFNAINLITHNNLINMIITINLMKLKSLVTTGNL